jgi:iron complex transport system ATP-binding protein
MTACTESTAVFAAADLSVGYRSRRRTHTVLQSVNLIASRGQLICLLGLNGSGKSTFLRTIAGLQPPLCGEIKVGGVRISDLSVSKLARLVGIVLPDRLLVDALPVRTIVEFGRFAHSGWWGILTDRDRRVVDESLGAVKATHLASRDCRQLSDGERQRVMIARALAQQPSLLVLDEPTAFLDVTARADIWRLLRHLSADRGLGIVASTHDLDWALQASDFIWLLMPDRTITAGTPDTLRSSGAIEQAFGPRRTEENT